MFTNFRYVLSVIFHLSIYYYPIALKGCQGIVFTHGVPMGRQAFGQAVRPADGGKKLVQAVSQKQ